MSAPAHPDDSQLTAEAQRLAADGRRHVNWKHWGPYLSERQWGTVREDYSEDGSAWDYFPHDHARSRAYRWGEDGLLGFSDRQCRLCFSVALWNGKDPFLKERLFGLAGPQGNHGEDVKEVYFYLDSTPTHSYARAMYVYPQARFPYEQLIEENARRDRTQPEFELGDTGVLDEERVFEVEATYAKAEHDDLCIVLRVTNRGPETASLALLPTLWYRNRWSWGRHGDEHRARPEMSATGARSVAVEHEELGEYRLEFEPHANGPDLLFTENETNESRLFDVEDGPEFTKDAFHAYVVDGKQDAVRKDGRGTKVAGLYRLELAAGATETIRIRLSAVDLHHAEPFGPHFQHTVQKRAREADEFYAERMPDALEPEQRRVVRQAYAGLLWSKQFYHYVVPHWLEGDPAQPAPPPARAQGRNADWPHVYNRDVVSMPDKWEYPWYAAWDLAFHMLPFARIDSKFAKDQLQLFLREWYMHPNGQIPAYEWALGDVNPPVHAWACWRVYKKSGPPGARDVGFLKSSFHKLLLNFTWWVNRKDKAGRHLFSGGFLGLDNIGVFDRSAPLPGGGSLDQADGTAWMAFFCGTMLSISLELARYDHSYQDMASKFFEHYVAIADAMNTLGGTGLWDEEDGFYYDRLNVDGTSRPLRIRSLVGLIPLIAVEVLNEEHIASFGGFKRRMNWFLENRPDLAAQIGYLRKSDCGRYRMLSLPSRERLERVLAKLLDETEFLSPYGIRSMSYVHEHEPFEIEVAEEHFRVEYAPGESETSLFGGNSNWRGPIWFPINFLLVEALERYQRFYGDSLTVELPTGSGNRVTLGVVAQELAQRLGRLFLPGEGGQRPCNAGDERFAEGGPWKDHVLFHEYFHADTGRGLGASHQTGWTALVATLLENLASRPAATPPATTPSEPVRG